MKRQALLRLSFGCLLACVFLGCLWAQLAGYAQPFRHVLAFLLFP